MKVVVSSKNSIVRDSLDVRIELDSLSLKLSLDRFFHSLAFKSFSSKKPSDSVRHDTRLRRKNDRDNKKGIQNVARHK